MLGASNCLRVGKFEDNLINASINGATLEKIDQCLGAAFENHRVKSNGSNVGKVIISLGTNDLSKNKHDSDQVNVYATQAIVKVKQAFPNADIGVCGIIPRKDASGVHITIEGAQTIRVKLREFLHPKMSPIQNTPRPCDTKRKLSDISLTPMSAEKDSKQSKSGSPDDFE
ncbi:Hypothetical predicted protein [Mytilus galloprovincialis]|uniref:SGNH hydrolase-type esterase domain-containing protein n=1 Tax=Mytilus galloprovincialis TaxID=29158 RepID=A0A8B6FCF3_MYTGA|nr:Hypothetical predicted protein [Mytilus galloprovincialis]